MISLLTVSSLLTISFALGISLWPTLILLFCLTCSVGLIFGNSSALALNEARHMAGSASAVMGMIQALLGGLPHPWFRWAAKVPICQWRSQFWASH